MLTTRTKMDDDGGLYITLNIEINRATERMGLLCVENAIYTLRKSKERKKAITHLFENAVKFHQLSLIDDSITRIRLYTTVDDDDSFGNSHNRYVVHHSLGPVLGFSLEGLRYVVNKNGDSAINHLPLKAYQGKYSSLPIINYSNIFDKNRTRSRNYKTECTRRRTEMDSYFCIKNQGVLPK